MRLKWIYAVLLSAFISLSPASAGLRDSVCVVSSYPGENAVKGYEEVASWVYAAGLEKLADRIRSMEGGGFGSGFITKLKDGSAVIVTNFHVIQDVDFVTLKFFGSDGSEREFPGCPVIAASGTMDLALIEIPDELNGPSLFVDDSIPEDGAEVWSAGYPGLGATPSWQLGRGTVTNSRAVVKDLGVSDIDFVIQHSAIIGHGNSGGPLLVKKKDGYEVVGVNTWSFLGRDNTYFAIPDLFLNKFLDDYSLKNVSSVSSPEELLTDRCRYFETIIKDDNKGYGDNVDLFSNYLVFKYGGESTVSLIKKLDAAPDEKELDDYLQMLYSSPFKGMGFALYRRIKAEYGVAGLKFESLSPESFTVDDEVIARYSIGDRTLDVAWRYQYNEWKISDIVLDDISSVVKPKSKKRQKKLFAGNIRSGVLNGFNLLGGITMGLAPSPRGKSWDMGVSPGLFFLARFYTGLGPFFGYDVGFSFQKIHFNITDTSVPADLDQPSYNLIMIPSDLRFQIPFDLSTKDRSLFLTPYVSIGFSAGIDLSEFTSDDDYNGSEITLYFPVNISAGIEVAKSKGTAYGIEVIYSMFGDTPVSVKYPGDYFYTYDDISLSTLTISATVSFYSN